ncbi:hypothetical protein ACFWWT_44645 [Streptomyces sp. NPDC058676]|uniref:hypothetical protein n=1 Tax=unclassified Streptomyces TaxID=2593676 RepID=UPI00365C7647
MRVRLARRHVRVRPAPHSHDHWLNNGAGPVQVAAWAGISVPVLLATHALCATGRLPVLRAVVQSSSRPVGDGNPVSACEGVEAVVGALADGA